MESKAEIKDDLISRIKKSEDLSFLKALQVIVSNSEQKVFDLSNEQQNSINQGRKDIKEGRFKSHNTVISEKRAWLQKQ